MLHDFIKDSIYLFIGWSFYQSCTEWFKIRKTFEIIAIVSTHFKHSQLISFPANRKIEMLTSSTNTFCHIGWRRNFSVLQILFDLIEDPWIANRSATNH